MADLAEQEEKIYGFYCVWTIRNFSICEPNRNLSISSEVFQIDILRNTKWYLNLEQVENDYLALILYRKESPTFDTVKFSLFIQTYFGWIPIIDLRRKRYKPNEVFGHGVSDFIKWQKINSENFIYLPNGSLTIGVRIYKNTMKSSSIHCSLLSEMYITNEVIHLSKKIFSTNPDTLDQVVVFPSTTSRKPQRKVKSQCIQADFTEFKNTFRNFDDLMRLLEEQRFSSVTIQTGNKEFSVYKALLCASSPVFSAMFDQDMKENKQNTVKINDIDSCTMSLLLRFLHLEPLKELTWKKALKLYYAADKYQIDLLKKECISFLTQEINEENICEAFILSDFHQEADLKLAAMDYFSKNSKYVLRSDEWRNLMLSQIELATQIMSEFAEKYCQKNNV